MANYTMHHLNVGSDTYEIVDETARENVAVALSAYLTDTASGSVATFSDGADGVPVKSLSVGIEAAQSGSGDPSPSNVRPISGWDTVTVYRAGENLWGGQRVIDGVQHVLVTKPEPDTTNKTISFSASASVLDDVNMTYNVRYKENTRYTFIITFKNESENYNYSNLRVYYTDNTYSVIPNASESQTKTTIVLTTTQGKTVRYLRKINQSGRTALYYDECAILEGVLTVDDFVPYVGTVYDIDLPQTVYGGTLDVSTGELTIDKAAVDLGTLTWQTNTSGVFYANGTSLGYLHNDSQAAICSKYLYNGSGNSSSVVASGPDKTVYLNLYSGLGWVFIKDTTYTDATAFKASLSGVQLVYEVDTPTTLTLTPEQVTTLLGTNNIYADAGEVAVTYRADTGLYIDKRLNA